MKSQLVRTSWIFSGWSTVKIHENSFIIAVWLKIIYFLIISSKTEIFIDIKFMEYVAFILGFNI